MVIPSKLGVNRLIMLLVNQLTIFKIIFLNFLSKYINIYKYYFNFKSESLNKYIILFITLKQFTILLDALIISSELCQSFISVQFSIFFLVCKTFYKFIFIFIFYLFFYQKKANENLNLFKNNNKHILTYKILKLNHFCTLYKLYIHQLLRVIVTE